MNYTEQERLEAAEWFIDIHDVEDPSAELLHDWMRWMEASEAHRQAFNAVERSWRDSAACLPAEPATAAAAAGDDAYDGSVSVHVWRARAANRASPPPAKRAARNHRRHLRLGFAAAAAIGAIALIAAPRLWSLIDGPAGAGSFATRTGEQMQVTLPDGSQVNLGARTKLTVAYTGRARDVRLEAGEAFFAVQKDAARPFRVHVLNGVVTAVGTAFDVRATNDRILVAVAEGTVQVNGAAFATLSGRTSPAFGGPELQSPALARLRRGEAISFSSGSEGRVLMPASVTHVDPAEPARWRDGWLVYRDEPLREVLADIARYTDRDIIVAESLSTNTRFTGAVFKDSILEWLQSLPNAFPVTVTTNGSRITVASASGAILAGEPK